jgi:hypothetical protein
LVGANSSTHVHIVQDEGQSITQAVLGIMDSRTCFADMRFVNHIIQRYVVDVIHVIGSLPKVN